MHPKEHQQGETKRKIPSSFTSRLETFKQVYLINGEPISYTSYAPESLIPHYLRHFDSSSNASTLKRNSTSQISLHSPQWLAQLGFYYTPLSMKHKYAITCSCCNQVIKCPIPSDIDICEHHLSGNSECALSEIWNFRNKVNKNKNTVEIVQNDSTFRNVESERAVRIRRETFKCWSYNYPNVDQMVLSGLYYDPLIDKEKDRGDDRVICMYCGLNLEQWEEGDDPIEAHRNANPSCWVFNSGNMENTKPHEELELMEIDTEIPDFEHDGLIEEKDHDIDDQVLVSDIIDDDNAHSVISINSTTTALPVELVDRDEIEEYLSNSQKQDQNQEGNKMVEIPSMKSSDLSQFFTELDAHTEDETGASFSTVNRKRRDKEKEEREKLKKNVDPIIEEPTANGVDDHNDKSEKHAEEEVDDNNDNNNSENQGKEEIDDNVIDDFPIYDNDNFAVENITIDYGNTAEKEEQTLPEANTENQVSPNQNVVKPDSRGKQPNDYQPLNRDIKHGPETFNEVSFAVEDTLQQKDKMQQSDTDGDIKKQEEAVANSTALANENIEKKDSDVSRVEQLESELKLLKHQIEALQNLQKNDNKSNVTDILDVGSNNLLSTAPKLSDKETDDTNKADIVSDTGSREEIDHAIINVKQELDEPKEINIEEKPKHSKKGKKKQKKSKRKHEELGTEGDSNDPLSLSSKKSKTKRSKKHDKVEKSGIKVESRNGEAQTLKSLVLKEVDQEKDLSELQAVQGSFQAEIGEQESATGHGLDDSAEQKTFKEDMSEVPTQIDNTQMEEAIAAHDINHPISPSPRKDNHIHSSNTKEHANTVTDGKHELSPTLLRKKGKQVSQMDRSISNEKPGYQVLDELINRDARGEGSAVDRHESKHGGNADTDTDADADADADNDQRFIIGSDFMLHNQSTPHSERVRDIKFDKVSKISDDVLLDAANTRWNRIDSSKYHDFYEDVDQATGYVKEVLDSPYELLGEDLDGLLTEFIAEIPMDQVKMTVREWIKCQEEQAVELVLEKADTMMQQFREDQQKAISFINTLPEE